MKKPLKITLIILASFIALAGVLFGVTFTLEDEEGVTSEHHFSFALPESGLRLSVSYKKWTRVDTEKSGQPLEPHIPCDPDYAYEKVCELM